MVEQRRAAGPRPEPISREAGWHNPGVTEIDEVLHQLGRAFVAGLREPGYQLTTVDQHGSESRTYTMAGEPALLGRWNNLDLDDAMAALPGVAGRGLVLEMIGSPDR